MSFLIPPQRSKEEKEAVMQNYYDWSVAKSEKAKAVSDYALGVVKYLSPGLGLKVEAVKGEFDSLLNHLTSTVNTLGGGKLKKSGKKPIDPLFAKWDPVKRELTYKGIGIPGVVNNTPAVDTTRRDYNVSQPATSQIMYDPAGAPGGRRGLPTPISNVASALPAPSSPAPVVSSPIVLTSPGSAMY